VQQNTFAKFTRFKKHKMTGKKNKIRKKTSKTNTFDKNLNTPVQNRAKFNTKSKI